MKIYFEKVRNSKGDLIDLHQVKGIERATPNQNQQGYGFIQVIDGKAMVALRFEEILEVDCPCHT